MVMYKKDIKGYNNDGDEIKMIVAKMRILNENGMNIRVSIGWWYRHIERKTNYEIIKR